MRILAWDICFFDGAFIGGEFMSDVVTKNEGIVTEVLPNSEVLEVANEIIDENIEALRALAK